jgi:hypothetical protein
MPFQLSPLQPFFVLSTQVQNLAFLTVHTDLSQSSYSSSVVLARRELLFATPGSLHTSSSRADLAPVPKANEAINALEPTGRDNASDHGSDASELTELSEPGGDDIQKKISKPTGEVGHPGRGGSNIEDALSWNVDDMSKLRVSCRLLWSPTMTILII